MTLKKGNYQQAITNNRNFMATERMKTCPISLIIREMQSKQQ